VSAKETGLSSTIQRVIDTRVEILGDTDTEDLAFLHAVLAQCSFPYREPAAGARDYIRENGRLSLIVSSGHLFDQKLKKAVLQGIPYGAKPRLLMIHLCTEAIKSQSPKIHIADSMSAFMRELGLNVSGGTHGSIARFKEQLNRECLFQCYQHVPLEIPRIGNIRPKLSLERKPRNPIALLPVYANQPMGQPCVNVQCSSRVLQCP